MSSTPAKKRKRARPSPDTNAKIWRLPAVAEYVARSRSSLLRDVAAGNFPRPIRLGEHSVGWLVADVESWLADRISERDGRAS